MLVGSIVPLTAAERHILPQNASHCPTAQLIETGRKLLLRYGNADNPLWLEFEQCLLKAELESLPLTAQIDLAPCLT
jgi:hypothetical protein